MKNKKSIGLPGGPNEFLKDITRHISVEGYKRYSKDVNNPYNIIESGNITMEDVDFPVYGTDNLGNEQIMMPGNNYQFPGDSVLEIPMAQDGREQATISQYEEPAWYEKALDRLASPMTAFGYSARNQDVPDNLPINMEERNAFDSVIDMVNPFAWIKYGAQANRDLEKSKYLDAGLNALGAIPVVPTWLKYGKYAKDINKLTRDLSKPIINKAKTNLTQFINDPVNINNPFGFQRIGDTQPLSDLSLLTPENIDLTKGFGNYAEELSKRQRAYGKKYTDQNLSENFFKGKARVRDQLNENITPFGKPLGSGMEGTVYEFANYPESVLKHAYNYSNKLSDINLPKEAMSFRNNATAIPLKGEKIFDNFNNTEGAISMMDNLNKVGLDSPLKLSKRNAYADLLKRIRKLRDSGIKIDANNTSNIRFNKDKGVYDIYDLQPGKGNPTYMKWIDQELRPGQMIPDKGSQFDYMNGGSVPKAQDGKETDYLTKRMDDFDGNFFSSLALPSFQGTGDSKGLSLALRNLYIGNEIEDGVISKSKYRPTKGDTPESNYYSITNDLVKEQMGDIIKYLEKNKGNYLQAFKEDTYNKYPNNPEYAEKSYNRHKHNSKYIGPVHQLSDTSWNIPRSLNPGNRKKNPLADLGNYQISTGEDERGKYYAYYDVWDTATPAEFIGAAKKFSVYDRIYLDELDQKQTGGSLPKAQAGIARIEDQANREDQADRELNQNIIIPKAINRSPPIPKSGPSRKFNVLDYNTLSNYLVDSRGGTIDTWGQLADTIAFHESSPWSRMDPKAKQYKGGPGRGLFQFEQESFDTALKRYKNIANAKGFTIKDSIVNAKSADELSSKDQYTLFLANLIESKAKLSDYANGKLSSLDLWLLGHKNVEADGDRESFLESKAAAEKEGIKNGYKTFQEGGEKYIVSAGDNLGKIANKYKTSVDELARLNNISDPNKININQELIIPKIPEESTLNKYTIKSGDTLGKLATKYNTSVTQLAKLNNIQDVNKINVNQELILPDSYREEKPLKDEAWYSVDDIQKNNDKVNQLTDENIIINSQLLNNPNQAYVVIDKKTQRLKLYRGDEVDLDFEVLTGANDGDAQTVTNVIDYNKDGITTEADKRGGKYKADWMAGNRSTGAGVYTINQSAPTSEDRYQNAPSFNLLNESGIQVGTSIHGTPGFRNKFFDDGNLENNSASNGCINGKCSDLQALYNMNLPTGTPVFILPEDEGNSFQQVDGKAVMRMSSKNRKDYLEYTDLRGNKQEGQGGNYSTSTLSYKPIRAKLDKKLFEEKVYSAFDFNDDEEFNNTTKPFINALEKNKKEIMQAAQIPGNVYNQIAKIAFGIYGTESNFGDTHSAAGNLGRVATKYLDREGSSSPDIVSKYNTYNVQGNNNSVGYTQIRWSQLNDKEKSALKSLDIISNKDFLNPEKSAIATATILGIRYNEQLTADQKKDVWKNLPSKWNNRSNYASRVKSNSRYLQFEQLDRLQKGGEIENNIMYKNYINGVYRGSKMESKAEKIYDKLNRLHYRDAKANQMTPANYVLTHVIG